MKKVDKKQDCKKCLYGMYDYADGGHVFFIGCANPKKCKGMVKPKEMSSTFEHNGVEYAVKQFEWLWYDGVYVSVNISKKDSDGKWCGFLHAGYCSRFLDDADIKELIDFALRAHQRKEK